MRDEAALGDMAVGINLQHIALLRLKNLIGLAELQPVDGFLKYFTRGGIEIESIITIDCERVVAHDEEQISLGILLIGMGTRSAVSVQFPYQMKTTDGNAEAAVRSYQFNQLGDASLDEAARSMNTSLFWSSAQTNADSDLISVSGIANYDLMRRTTPFTITFRVMNDGRAKVESATLNQNPSSIDRILDVMGQTANHVQRIKQQQAGAQRGAGS